MTTILGLVYLIGVKMKKYSRMALWNWEFYNRKFIYPGMSSWKWWEWLKREFRIYFRELFRALNYKNNGNNLIDFSILFLPSTLLENWNNNKNIRHPHLQQLYYSVLRIFFWKIVQNKRTSKLQLMWDIT
jgi:hypothetical protein